VNAVLRREFLKAGGGLIVGFALRESLAGQSRPDPAARPAAPGPPDPNLIDTWLAVHADNTVTVYIGFAELGQGASTALLQIAAEELDVDMSQVKTVRLDTSVTPNQGGTYASASIQRGGPQIRKAAAEARFALLKIAAARLSVPMEALRVSKGMVSGPGESMRTVTYGELTGGKLLQLPFTGSAPLKPVAEYKVVGARIPRNDVPDKVAGRYTYMQFVTVPNMLHGRLVRPVGQRSYGSGAKVLSIEEDSIRSIPGARVLRKGDFVGVVAENEWDAIRAVKMLKVNWGAGAALPGTDGVHQQMRAASTTNRVVLERGDVAGAFDHAAHVFSGSFHGPYQAHGPLGPNCAIADINPDSALVMCSTQDVYATRSSVARMTGLPVEKVCVQYYEGAGTYGRSCYEDAAEAAAILSQLGGRPVRLQFMRWDEHGWDNFGPAHVGDVRAAVDRAGKIVAYEYHGWQHNWTLLETSEELALAKAPEDHAGGGASQQVSAPNLGAMYDIANMRLVTHVVPNLGYLRAAWLRSPMDLSFSFASEQAIDQLAFLSGTDPYVFRRNNIRDPRWMDVLKAVAKAANWMAPKHGSRAAKGKLVRGRGIGLGTHVSSYGAAVAEIELDRETGVISVKHMYGAVDCGLAVNPAFVENQISGQLVQAVSRMLKEEVTFDHASVTSLDWAGYPILRFDESPEVTAVVVQRLNESSTGAGEELMAAAAAAIANAFFDASGVRMRRYPMSPKRVLEALATARRA
jgi:nicotinate dehydrogenase subunit B